MTTKSGHIRRVRRHVGGYVVTFDPAPHRGQWAVELGGDPPVPGTGRAGLAVATFLLKILDPHFFVRNRPDRTSPRATKKTDDFPARKDRPSAVHVTRRIQIHCLRPRLSG